MTKRRTKLTEFPYDCPHDRCGNAYRTDADLQQHLRLHHQQQACVSFYKDGDSMGISTTATTEEEFLEGVTAFLATAIEANAYNGDWQFQLEQWLPHIVEMCCALRGYPAEDVTIRERTLAAGYVNPEALLDESINRG